MSEKNLSILLGGLSVGVIATVLSFFTGSNPQSPVSSCLGCVICLLYIGSGMIAVWHYTNTNDLTITGGQGAGMGALAGLVAGVVAGALGFLFRALGLLPSVDEIIAGMENSGQFDQLDAETADQVIGMVELMSGPLSIVIGIVVALIAGVIGGAIGAALFKKGSDAPDVTPGV